jgi:hypothetical protein
MTSLRLFQISLAREQDKLLPPLWVCMIARNFASHTLSSINPNYIEESHFQISTTIDEGSFRREFHYLQLFHLQVNFGN